VLLLLENRFEAGTQRERRLAGARTSTERDNPDLRVEQQVDGQTLLDPEIGIAW
jgi:hypothetical protein